MKALQERLRWHESQRDWHQRQAEVVKRLIADTRISRVLRKGKE